MKKILVCSGKGGTGKTTISVNLAKALKDSGFRVGILDVDVDCPNIPEMMNITERDLELSDNGIVPKLVDEIEVMSIGLVASTDIAIMWDANRRAMSIHQMINKVDWTCDVLIIDSSPGTSDEVKTVISKFNPDGIIIVTTNHKASISDVKRTLAMIDVLGVGNKLIGIIKNMTYIICTKCGEKMNLFESEKDQEIEELVIGTVPYLPPGEGSIGDYLTDSVDKIIEVL